MRVISALISYVRRLWELVSQALSRNWKVGALLIPIGVMAVALAGYAWWWRVLADRVHESVVDLQAEQKALGRDLEWSAFEIGGFPYLVDATLSKTRLLAPDIGASWDGERIVVRLRPFSLNRLALSLEGEQHLFYVADGRWIEADARADKALLRATSKDDVQTVSADIEQLTGKGKLDASDFHFILENAQISVALHAISEDSATPRLDIFARVENLGLQGNLDWPLGPAVEHFDIDVSISLPEKLPAANFPGIISAWKKTNSPIQIRRFAFEWGGVSVDATGELKLDGRDLPEGTLKLVLGNHARILELLESSGWITPQTHATAKPVLDVLTFVSGDPKRRISVPLKFENGDVYLGPAKIMKMQAADPAPPIPDFIP